MRQGFLWDKEKPLVANTKFSFLQTDSISSFKNRDSEKKYRVYLRDWYYNAGIVGFLNVLSKGKRNLEEIGKEYLEELVIENSYLEFTPKVLENFYEKYIKMVFNDLFNLEGCKKGIDKLINKLDNLERTGKKISQNILKEVGLDNKWAKNFINVVYGKDLKEILKTKSNISVEIQQIKNVLDMLNSGNEVFEYLIQKGQKKFIFDFLDEKINKTICHFENINSYIQGLKQGLIKTRKNDEKCYVCQEFKKDYDFSNAISQIIGFNQDNTNFIWGFKEYKARICSLCALIYSCAVHGMITIERKVNNNYKTFFYFVNNNNNIQTLYNSFWLLKEKISSKENQKKPLFVVMQEVVLTLIQKKAQAVIENINFIEVQENNLGSQGTSSYNIYNYNLTKELASFLNDIKEKIPQGYYKYNDIYVDLREELLKKTLDYSLSFSDLNKYFEYYLRSLNPFSKIKIGYNLSQVRNYIFQYITKLRGGDEMMLKKQNPTNQGLTNKDPTKKAFYNGQLLREKIKRENKIKSIAYQLLSDLRIGDRNSFIDKYLRLCTVYDLEVKLGSHGELIDMDNFLKFGYAFVNGLLTDNSNKKETNIEVEENNLEEVENG